MTQAPTGSPPTDEAGWFDLVLGNQAPLWRLFADAFGGDVLEIGAVQATLVPGSPERSFFNSVFYSDTDEFLDAIPRLADAYEEAGVNAWTVWVPATDEGAAGALADAGHVLDAKPRAMGLVLSELQEPDPDPGLEIRGEWDIEAIRSINEVAYGYAPGDIPAMKPIEGTDPYVADLDGARVGTAIGWDRGFDCEVLFVATLPEARGRGVARRLLAHALGAARERGLEASTLIATKLGYPVYEALGYRDYGTLQMWERRRKK